jgi:DNA-directed RNA polymerase specialized sigma24 family protein
VTEDETRVERDTEDAVARAVAAVAALPMDQRKVLTVAVASDMPYTEIARQGGFEESSVLSWMRGGLHAIAEALDDSEPWIDEPVDESPKRR